MLISINGPLAGKLSIIQICDTYGALLRRLGWTAPSRAIDALYGINIGWGMEQIKQRPEPLLTDLQRRAYYHQRLIGNVLSFVEVLSLYLEQRLSSLNDIQQGRVDVEINTEKSPRFFYNLPGGVVAHIQNILENHRDGIDYLDYDRLRMRIEMESATILQTSGMIAPNRRCDETVKAFIKYRPKMVDAILKDQEKLPTKLAEYLLMWTYITRLYFGAVNLQDQDIHNFSQLPPEAKTLCVSDDLVAAAPSPSFESLKAFQREGNGRTSLDAVRYVSALNDYYLVRD